jgi:hypothetical protein
MVAAAVQPEGAAVAPCADFHCPKYTTLQYQSNRIKIQILDNLICKIGPVLLAFRSPPFTRRAVSAREIGRMEISGIMAQTPEVILQTMCAKRGTSARGPKALLSVGHWLGHYGPCH